MDSRQAEIQEIVDRETHAWDTQDVELLLGVFHPDMVWPWPPDPSAHDPISWVLMWGRYDRERWRKGWQDLFDTHELIHNRRITKRIVMSDEGDGAFAVVDIDTLWRSHEGVDNHWIGRTCKIYTLMGEEWKMSAQTGALEY